jgi:hypothetical protein
VALLRPLLTQTVASVMRKRRRRVPTNAPAAPVATIEVAVAGVPCRAAKATNFGSSKPAALPAIAAARTPPPPSEVMVPAKDPASSPSTPRPPHDSEPATAETAAESTRPLDSAAKRASVRGGVVMSWRGGVHAHVKIGER